MQAGPDRIDGTRRDRGGLEDPTALDDRHERERDYSPSSCIGGNYQPFITAYATRSREARRGAESLGGRWVTLAYGAKATQRVELCVPAPRTGVLPGLLVFIHGGYWQELSAADSLFAAAQCVEQGLAFAAIDYTLAPAATVADIVGECRHALTLLMNQAEAHGIDAANIVVAGSSAGAHLAAMVALPRAPGGLRPPQPLRAVVLVSGIFALEPLIGTSIDEKLGLTVATALGNSPRWQPLPGFPPAVVCWGEIETAAFKSESLDFASALRGAGTPCTTFEVPARNHFDVILDLADPGTLLGRQTLSLFDLA